MEREYGRKAAGVWTTLLLAGCALLQVAWLGGGGKAAGFGPGSLGKVVVAPERTDCWQGVVLRVRAVREHPESPVEADLGDVQASLEASFRGGGAELATVPGDALDLRLVISKFSVERFSGGDYRCYADFAYELVDPETAERAASQGVRSISGRGSSRLAAAVDALERIQRHLFGNPSMTDFLTKRRLSTSGMLGLRARQLVNELHASSVEALKKQAGGGACRIALAEIKGDTDQGVGSILLPELQKVFAAPVFEFYSRLQLDQILKEQSLQMSDLVDEDSSVEFGALKGVDYLIVGNVSDAERRQILHLQVSHVADGKIIGSASVQVPRTD